MASSGLACSLDYARVVREDVETRSSVHFRAVEIDITLAVFMYTRSATQRSTRIRALSYAASLCVPGAAQSGRPRFCRNGFKFLLSAPENVA